MSSWLRASRGDAVDRPRESQIGMHTCARVQEPGREIAFGGVGVVVVSRDRVCRRQRGDVARHVDEQRARCPTKFSGLTRTATASKDNKSETEDNESDRAARREKRQHNGKQAVCLLTTKTSLLSVRQRTFLRAERSLSLSSVSLLLSFEAVAVYYALGRRMKRAIIQLHREMHACVRARRRAPA